MQQLGIDMIAAYLPQARGRSERVFRTLQDRLVKELAEAGIETMEQANQFLKETYWPRHNERFAVTPSDPESAFVPWCNSGMNLQDTLCIQEQRTVGKDNTISYKGKLLQIPQQTGRCNYVKVKVRVHEYADGKMAVFHGPRKLAVYEADGNIEQITLDKAA